jgi:Xaa-Pro aminopeptidase
MPPGTASPSSSLLRSRLARHAAVAALAALATAAAHAGELQDELAARRARLMQALGPEALFVHRSAPVKAYSTDVDYEYRQDSDLLYLTGIDQEGTVLVLMPGNRTKREILFVRDPDPRKEHREGHLLTPQEASAASGIAEVRLASELDRFLTDMMNRRPFDTRWSRYEGEFEAFFDALLAGRARLALVFGRRPGPAEELPPVYAFAERLRQRFVGASVVDATASLWALRQVKTPYEQQVLRRSGEVSSEAHRAALRATRPGRYEYEVEAALEQVYLERGASGWSYPSIVGSGPNATVLHYNRSSRQMQAGELLLIDAAANYQGLTVDITRTWPVSGRYSPEQAALWSLVLEAQEAGMRAAVVGNTTADVERAVEGVVRAGLARLGLVTDARSEQFRTWYTHGICHWIGMDVHDEGDDRRPLEPGMAFVIEPGLYVREASLQALPDTPENRAFREAVAAAVARYKDIGVRVEDSFLLTGKGLERLSAGVPRTPDEIEAFLAKP